MHDSLVRLGNVVVDLFQNRRHSVYTPLDPTAHTIRLLRLEPDARFQPLTCLFNVVNLHTAADTYTAISYVWGRDRERMSLQCDNETVRMRRNLHEVLLRLRYTDRARLVWADAVCINQKDQNEKSNQISKMGGIYQKAAKVVVWLGSDAEAPGAFRAIRDMCAKICVRKDIHNLADVAEHNHLWPVVRDIEVSSFAPCDSDDWLPIRWFFEQPWFQRVWVIQEVSANRNIEVFCEQDRIPWAAIGLVATWLGHHSHYFTREDSVFRSFRGIENARFMCERALYTDEAWLRLLEDGRAFRATNPRDKVYGLIGHPAVIWGRDDGVRGLGVDYSQSLVDIYADVVIRHIRQARNLNVLSQVDHGEALQHSKSCTWIPRWHKQRWANPLVLGTNKSTGLNAGGGSCAEIVQSRDTKRVLKLEGLVLCTVKRVSATTQPEHIRTDADQSNFNPAFAFWLDLVAGQNSPSAVIDISKAMALAMTAGGGGGTMSSDDTPSVEEFAAYMLCFVERATAQPLSPPQQRTSFAINLLRQLTNDDEVGTDSFENLAADVLLYRRLFTTADGYIGVGPEAMHANDQVCVLYGGKVLLVIRRKRRGWALVGEAYIHEYMSGRAIHEAEAGTLQQETFTFV